MLVDVGISRCPGPPYFVMLIKQWAAVRSHCAPTRVPPQTCTDIGGAQTQRILAIPAQAPDPGRTSVPPTTRDELKVARMGRSPQIPLKGESHYCPVRRLAAVQAEGQPASLPTRLWLQRQQGQGTAWTMHLSACFCLSPIDKLCQQPGRW